MFPGLNLGSGILFTGLLLVMAVWLGSRLLTRAKKSGERDSNGFTYPASSQTGDAVLLLQPGGRVEYINLSARKFFGLREDEPYIDLDSLTRKVRPSGEFLNLCAAPGHTRLMVEGKLAQATSYAVPGYQPLMLIALRPLEMSQTADQGGEEATVMVKLVTDLSQAFSAKLDLVSTVQTVLENIRRIMPSDILELKLWDDEDKLFKTYRLKDGTGSLQFERSPESPPGVMSSPVQNFARQRMHTSLPNVGEAAGRLLRAEVSQFGTLTEQLVTAREALALAGDQLTDSTRGNGYNPIIRSYLGVPLRADGEMIGLLEAGKSSDVNFSPPTVELLQLVSTQAAQAIRNAQRYELEAQRAIELAGLAELFQSLSSYESKQEIFKRLVEPLYALFGTEIVGFLLFDEDKRALEGMIPFIGLPQDFVEIYRTSIPVGSPAEKVFLGKSPIITMNAMQDENVRTLGLTDVATAASLKDSVFMPLTSGDKTLGYLQVAHHRNGPVEFSKAELRLIQQAADQSAAAIVNFMLVHKARRGGQRAEALQRLGSITGSTDSLEAILANAIQEIGRLFGADSGSIFILDESSGVLEAVPGASFGLSENAIEFFPRLSLDDPAYRSTVTGAHQARLSARLSSEHVRQPLYAAIINSLHLESMIVSPLIVRGRCLGEIMLASPNPDWFDASDLDFLNSAASNLATVIESRRLIMQSEPELRKQLERLSAFTRVNRELTATLDVQNMLAVIHSEGLLVSKADCASVFIFEPTSQTNAIQVESHKGCSEGRELTAFERKALEENQSFLITDFDREGLERPHAGIASALLVPILQRNKAVGAIHLHSNQAGHFTPEMTEFVKALAGQVGIALSNAQIFQNEQKNSMLQRRRAETLKKLAQVGGKISEELPLELALQTIATGIREATPFRVVLMSILDKENGLLQRITAVGIPDETLKELIARKQPLTALQHLMQPQFKISHSYFIPADQTPILPADVHYVYSTYEVQSEVPKENAWDPDDFLIFPIEDSKGEILGLISVDDPSDGLRPDLATIDSIEAFSVQAALVLAHNKLISGLRDRVATLDSGLQRQQKLLDVTQNDLPVLLRKDLEATISLHNLDQRAQRVRAGLAITEQVSRQLDSSSALLALGRETLTQLGMTAAMVAENSADGPRLLHTLGSVPRTTNVDALFGQRNPLRTCMQTGEAILVSSMDESEEWRDSPLLTSLRVKSFICLPVYIQEKPVAAMLALSPETMPAFTTEDRQVYFQIARQSSVILQNISLLNETRRRLQEVNLLLDFSRRLTGLDSDAILKTLLNSAMHVIPSAHAGTVLVWNQQAGLLLPLAVSGYADNETMGRIQYRSGEALPGTVYAEKRIRRVDEVNFARDYVLVPENITLYRQAVGGRMPVSCIHVPILTGEQCLGVLTLDNFNTQGAFKSDDETLLISLTQQVALSFENVRLMQAMRERAGQLQALNDVATSLTSSLRSDQLVGSLLDNLTPILPFDSAAFWFREGDQLTVVATRGYPDTENPLGASVGVTENALFDKMSQTGQAISIGDVREDARFPRVEAPRLSWLGIPLVSKGVLAGVLALEKWQAYYYAPEQIQVGLTFASQAAVALENARLYEDSLNRAEELDERSQRLALLNRFSSSLSGLLDIDQILQLAAEELLKAVGAERVSVVTFESNQAIWKTTVPRMKINLPRLLPEAPIFVHLRESLGVFNTDDAHNEGDVVPLKDMLGEETTALMVISIPSGQNLAGLLFAQSTGAAHYSPVEIELARTISNQVSISLDNARLYQSNLQTANRLNLLHETSSEVSAHSEADEIYVSVHKAAEKLMRVDSIAIGLLDEKSREIEGVYLVEGKMRSLPIRVSKDQGLNGEVIRTGQSILLNDQAKIQAAGGRGFGKSEDGQSMILVPMMAGGKVRGVLSVQSSEPGVYTYEDQQILGTLANQAIVGIQNEQLLAETRRLTQELDGRVTERTSQLEHDQHHTETLLKILTEVSSSLDLDRALNRTLSLLNNTIGAEQGTIMLLHPEDNLLHFQAGYGYVSERSDTASRNSTLKIGEGLAGWVVRNRQPALVGDLHTDPRWLKNSEGTDHRSCIAIPMIVGDDVIGVLLVYHRAVNYFNPDMQNLVKAVAAQVAVAINNAHLYELIRDQADRLGVMLRKEQEDASRSQAILAAVADGVLVTGANNQISFINPSIERILHVEKSKLLGSPLDSFAGVFGKSSGAWMTTIRRWSEEPSIYQAGDTYAEQLELEDGRIALVHLAPVIMENEFLGTVSIFSDITQQVEVDRMKSEFVSTVSHELRTPMTSIKGYVDLLQMGAAGALNDNQEHFVDIVSNNINRLNMLLDELLDISRFEAGHVIITPAAVDLVHLAEEAVVKVKQRSEKENKPMTIKLAIEEDLSQIIGDAQHVRTILNHLLDNAYNYTPENGVISLQIISGEQDDVQVDIKDNGIGIPTANQEQVFERFWRGDDERVLATPGTGLGLPIVRQLVEMHKGKIWLKSFGVPGEGSVFSFTLPKHIARDRKADMRTARLYGEGEDLLIPPKDPPRDLGTPGASSS